MKNYRAPQKYQPGRSLSNRLRPAILGLTLLGASVSSAVEVTYQYYRFTPTKNYGDSAPDATTVVATTNVQLSEFTFSLRGTPLNINGKTGFGPAVTVTASGGTNDAGAAEGANAIVDGSLDTKWYNGTRSLPLVFNFGTPTTIDGYNFATANDFMNRTPISWTLEGSADGTTWVVVDTKANVAPTTEFKFYQAGFTVDGSTALPAIDFGTAVTLGADPSITNVAASAIIKAGTATSLGWTVTGSTATTLLTPSSATPATVTATGTQAVTPTTVGESSYTLSATGATGADASTVKVRRVQGGTVSYRYYRFTTVARRGGRGDNLVQLSGFEFFSGATERQVASVTNPGGNNLPAETPDLLLDDNTATKWLDFNNKPLVFEMTTDNSGVAPTVDSYQFYTANDSPDRDPVRWTLEGTNDLDGAWTIVDAIDGTSPYPTPTTRLTATGKMLVTGTALRWSGSTSAAWDTTVSNFKYLANTTSTTFRDGVPVVFDDTATQTAVTLGSSVQPAWLGFTNSTKNITLSGAGSLAGQMKLSKSGAGTATLGTVNAFTGDIEINNGTLASSVAGALGPRTLNRTLTFTSLFTDTPTLLVSATQTQQGKMVFAGDNSTAGTINVADTFTFNHYGPLQIDTSLVKTGKGTLHLESFRNSSSNGLNDDLVVNEGMVEIAGSYFNTIPIGNRTFVATVNGGGVLRLANNDSLGGDYADFQSSVSQLKVVGGGILRLNGNQYVPTPLVNGEGAIVLDGGYIDGGNALNASKSGTGRSTITVRANAVGSEIRNTNINTTGSTFDPGAPFVFDVADGAAADDLSLLNVGGTYKITGNYGIVKQGAGNMVLSQASDYLGTAPTDTFGQPDGTTVAAGTLTVTNTTGSATGAGTVLVNSGATLAGTGIITGATTVAGSISPGKGGIGTLTLGKTTLTGGLNYKVSGATADKLVVTGDLNLTGSKLAVTATSPTASTYVIASYTGTLTGSFATVTGVPTGYTVVSNTAAKTIELQSGATQTGFEAWASAAGLTGADALTTADPDGDGVKNGIEFVIGGNPKVADTANLPTATRDASGNLVFTFRRTSASAYLNPGVQYSADLVTWTAAPTASVTETKDGFATGVDKVVATLPASLAPGAKLFARLVDTTNAQ